jgi:hypothetical protein
VKSIRCVFVAAVLQVLPVSIVFAQSGVRDLPARPTLGVSLNGSMCSAVESGDGVSLDVAVSAERPIDQMRRARLDVGVTNCLMSRSWVADGPAFERMRVGRTELTMLVNDYVPNERFPIGLYWGMGTALYSYTLRQSGVRSFRAGLHLVGGFQFVVGRHLEMNTEAKIALRGGPTGSSVSSMPQIILTAGSAFRYRF